MTSVPIAIVFCPPPSRRPPGAPFGSVSAHSAHSLALPAVALAPSLPLSLPSLSTAVSTFKGPVIIVSHNAHWMAGIQVETALDMGTAHVIRGGLR